jgi:hypothetical protein
MNAELVRGIEPVDAGMRPHVEGDELHCAPYSSTRAMSMAEGSLLNSRRAAMLKIFAANIAASSKAASLND